MKKFATISSIAATFVILLSSILFLGAAAAPDTGAGFAKRFGDGPLGRLLTGRIGRAMVLKSEMNLTAEQKDQLKTILLAHKAEIATAIKPVVEKKRALRDAVLAQTPDDKAIRAAATELGTAIGDAAVTLSKVKAELAKVLTPDQLKLLEKFHADNDTAIDGFFKEMTK